MSAELTVRMGELGARLAVRMPRVLAAAITLLEVMARAFKASRPGCYEIQRPIGAGGQAEVLTGVIHGAYGFERRVALKRVRADLLAPARDRYTEVLSEEARLAADLWHPNVISVFDYANDLTGWPFLVMEYIDGVDLATLVEAGPVPTPAVIFIVSELLAGLGYLHEHSTRGGDRARGLVHHDVTPHNVLLSREGAVKLTDLGLARTLEGPTTTAAYVPAGTTGYMSPEQARGEPLDGRSDLYAVGIVLWELLTFRRLRVGPAGWKGVEVGFQAIPRPSEYRPNVPADLEAVAMRLLAFHPDERYPTAALAARDLVHCQSASREGRTELVRLLADRVPRARQRRSDSRPPEWSLPSNSYPPEWDLPSNGRITESDTSAPPAELLSNSEDDEGSGGPPALPRPVAAPSAMAAAEVASAGAPAGARDRDDHRAPRGEVPAMPSAPMPRGDCTNTDPGGTGWAINDPVTRLRVLGSERVFDLVTAERWVLGSSPDCSLQLDDPSGRISRRHAEVSHEGPICIIADLGSTNGLRVNGEARRWSQLAPGDEVELGGITLIAESPRWMELHALVQRWLGWSPARLAVVDRALGAIRDMANLRTALVLQGVGSLAGVAWRLHQITLGDRPFVQLGPNERGEQALNQASNGMLCVDARGLPHDMPAMIATLRTSDLRVRLLVCSDDAHPRAVAELAGMVSRVAVISVPPLVERKEDLPRLLATYGADAAVELGASNPNFLAGDLERVRTARIATIDEIEVRARRLVAIRNWGVTAGAERLGISHGALSRWARRRKIPT